MGMGLLMMIAIAVTWNALVFRPACFFFPPQETKGPLFSPSRIAWCLGRDGAHGAKLGQRCRFISVRSGRARDCLAWSSSAGMRSSGGREGSVRFFS